jgi:2-C-methyl-D-erythritol 4-phosphate cytidylyltransferase
MKTTGIIVAAGLSQRLSGGGLKQLMPLAGVPMVVWSVRALATVCDALVIAAPPGREHELEAVLPGVDVPCAVVAGGETRQDSVRLALDTMADDEGHVLIHDAARPCVSRALLGRITAALVGNDAVVPVIPAVDTLVRERESRAEAVLDRAHIAAVQTPQAFRTALIVAAHRKAQKRGFQSSDDGSLVLAMGEPLATVPGERTNIKVTYEEDIALVEAILNNRSVT